MVKTIHGDFQRILDSARDCKLCEAELLHDCRPVLRAWPTARLLIVGQAPGRRVHESGVPWDDPSGDRLRQWLNVDKNDFYDETRIAIIPMGLCYPGTGKNGDLPPMPRCAPHWHPQLRPALPDIELTLLVGQYAQRYYLGKRRAKSLTDTVRAWREYLPEYLPMPHPSPRNIAWFKRNPWFEEELVSWLKDRMQTLLNN